MRARFGALCDHGIHAGLFQPPRFFHRGCSAENRNAARLEAEDCIRIGNTEREAEDWRSRVEHCFKLRREWIWRRRWRDRRRDSELVVNFAQEFEHGCGVAVLPRAPAAREQVYVEW